VIQYGKEKNIKLDRPLRINLNSEFWKKNYLYAAIFAMIPEIIALSLQIRGHIIYSSKFEKSFFEILIMIPVCFYLLFFIAHIVFMLLLALSYDPSVIIFYPDRIKIIYKKRYKNLIIKSVKNVYAESFSNNVFEGGIYINYYDEHNKEKQIKIESFFWSCIKK